MKAVTSAVFGSLAGRAEGEHLLLQYVSSDIELAEIKKDAQGERDRIRRYSVVPNWFHTLSSERCRAAAAPAVAVDHYRHRSVSENLCFHLPLAGNRRRRRTWTSLRRVETVGTRNLIQLCRENGAQRNRRGVTCYLQQNPLHTEERHRVFGWLVGSPNLFLMVPCAVWFFLAESLVSG